MKAIQRALVVAVAMAALCVQSWAVQPDAQPVALDIGEQPLIDAS